MKNLKKLKPTTYIIIAFLLLQFVLAFLSTIILFRPI